MIGDKLRERRLQLQLTQLQVAELTSIKKNTISNYENNISSPSEENLMLLMKVLKCDANYLFSDFVNNKSFSPKEQEYIERYRILDEHGKKIVDFVLSEEYNRCIHDDGMYYRAASSTDNHPAQIVRLTDEERQRLAVAKPVSSEDSDL